MRKIKHKTFKNPANSRLGKFKNLKAKKFVNQIAKNTLKIKEDIPQKPFGKPGDTLDINNDSKSFLFIEKTERTDKANYLYKVLGISSTFKAQRFISVYEKWTYCDIGKVLPNYYTSK